MTIRLAKKTDIPALLDLLDQILQVHHHVRPDIFQSTGGKYNAQELEERMMDPKTPVYVFVDDNDQVLGHLFITLKESQGAVLVPIKTLFIDDLCVDGKARGQHIGEQLYHFAEQLAKEMGCYNLTLNVWNANAGAVRFYERLGLKPQETVMEQILKND